MASTNKTPQLGLNQWAAGDSVLREDFNGDNQKIEATVETLRNENCMVKLIDITTTTASAQYDLDVSGIVWSKYTEVIIYANIRCNSSIAYAEQGYLRINGKSGASDYNVEAVSQGVNYCNICYFQTSVLGARNKFSIRSMDEWYTICGEATYEHSNRTACGYCVKVPKLADVHTMNFVATNTDITLVPGSRFLVYGVRK